VKIGLEQSPNLLDRAFFCRAGDSESGIVDEQIDATELSIRQG
jgi:hypothetical protein